MRNKIIPILIVVLFLFGLIGCNNNFCIVGTWINVGEEADGQAQRGAVIVFTETNVNLFSPNDTYAFYEAGGGHRLDVTGILGGNLSYDVRIVDNNTIELSRVRGGERIVLVLERVR